jgi:hypothetical protein
MARRIADVRDVPPVLGMWKYKTGTSWTLTSPIPTVIVQTWENWRGISQGEQRLKEQRANVEKDTEKICDWWRMD